MTSKNTPSDELSEQCPQCESEDIEWGHDATMSGMYCNDCEAYVEFVDTEQHVAGGGVMTVSRDETEREFPHFHYVCPECGHEVCPEDTPTAGSWLAAAETHVGNEHPDQWGPGPELEVRGDCSAA